MNSSINTSIFKAYDIRGIYPTDISPEIVEKVGIVCAKLFNEGEIIVAYDARYGSPELAQILETSLSATAQKINKKITIRKVGFSTTPMFYFLVNHFNASGGCMVTASHNPKNYNGIKVVKEKAEMIAGTDILKLIQNL